MVWSAPARASSQWKSLDSVPGISTGVDVVAAPAPGQTDGDPARIETWDDLFRVIRQSLGETDDWFPAMSAGASSLAANSRLSPGVLQCVAELHRLHPTVMRELGRHAQLETQVLDAHSALARVRGDLIGTGKGV